MTDFINLQSWQWTDYDELESTNDVALGLSAELLPGQKIVITAKKQTKGRGRRGRVWIGLDDNLFMSMLFRWPLADTGALVLMVSLSLLNTVKFFSPDSDIKLKWPNDVLLNGSKMSGILLERKDNNNIVVGIGVNIKSAPSDNNMLYPVTSLSANGIICEREDFLKRYLVEFNQTCDLYAEKGLSAIVTLWRQNAKGIGQKIIVRTPKGEQVGIFKNLSNDGLLQLLTTDGAIKTISAGDVFFDVNGEDNKQ